MIFWHLHIVKKKNSVGEGGNMKGHARAIYKNFSQFSNYVFNTEIIYFCKFSKQKAIIKSHKMPDVNVFPL